jgi:hypothetical protein
MITELVFILKYLILFSIPGLLVSFLVFNKKEIDKYERIAYSIGFSILLALIFGLILSNMHQISFNGYLLYYFLVAVLFYPLYALKKKFSRPEVDDSTVKKYIKAAEKKDFTENQTISSLIKQKVPLRQIENCLNPAKKYENWLIPCLVALIIIITGLLVYIPHYSYDYPMHVDEWRIARDSLKTVEYKSLAAPEASGDFKDYTETEPGVYLITAMLYSFAGLSWETTFKFLAAFNMMISAFLIFVFARALTKNSWTGVFAMIFFASIKSNVNILGPWFYVGLMINVPLVFLCFHSLNQAVRSDSLKLIVTSIILFLGVAVIYPYAAAYVGIVAVLYLIFNFRFLLKHKIVSILAIASPILLFMITFSTLKKGTFAQTLAGMWARANFPVVYASFEPKYDMIMFFGAAAFFLAVIGIIIAVKKYKLVAIWPIFLAAFFLYNQDIRWDYGSFLIPYLRLFVMYLISLPVPAAIGLTFVCSLVLKLKLQKPIQIAILLALCISVFGYTFSNYADIPSHIAIYHIIEKPDIQLIRQLDAPFIITYKINDRPIKLVTNQTYSYFIKQDGLESDCPGLMDFVFSKKYPYLLADAKFDCGSWFELQKENNGRYLYRININDK